MFLELFNNTNMMWYFLQVRLQEDIPVYEKNPPTKSSRNGESRSQQ